MSGFFDVCNPLKPVVNRAVRTSGGHQRPPHASGGGGGVTGSPGGNYDTADNDIDGTKHLAFYDLDIYDDTSAVYGE